MDTAEYGDMSLDEQKRLINKALSMSIDELKIELAHELEKSGEINMGANTDSGNIKVNPELEKFADKQYERIGEFFKFLADERIVTNKHVALQWIVDIALNYDGQRSPEDLMTLIDELIAYAQLGLEKPE